MGESVETSNGRMLFKERNEHFMHCGASSHLKLDSLPFSDFDFQFHMCIRAMYCMGQWAEATWFLR